MENTKSLNKNRLAVVLIIAILININAIGQSAIDTNTTNLNNIIDITFIKDISKGKNLLILPRNLDSILYKYQFALAGFAAKEGRTISRNAVIDEKSLTLNYSLHPCKRNLFFINPVVSIEGEDNFSSIFSKAKFTKKYTAGLGILYFFGGRIYNNDSNNLINLYNNLRIKRTLYHQNRVVESTRISTLITQTLTILNDTILDSIYHRYKRPILIQIPLNDSLVIQNFKILDDNLEALVKEDILTKENIEEGSYKIIQVLALTRTNNKINESLTRKYIKETDRLQIDFPFSKKIFWISANTLYNSQEKPINLNYASNVVNPYHNKFVSFNIAANGLWIKEKRASTLSVNFTYSNARNFDKDDKRTMNFETPIIIGGITSYKLDSTISFFDKIPDKMNTWNLEIPYTYFWNKTNFGIDVAIKFGENNINNDNVGARFGVFVPVNKFGENTVLIEPLIRISKLFNSSTQVFFRDNVSIGINLKVDIAKIKK